MGVNLLEATRTLTRFSTNDHTFFFFLQTSITETTTSSNSPAKGANFCAESLYPEKKMLTPGWFADPRRSTDK